MAQAVRDSFLDLERHRQLLEENIAKLQKTLRHWQTWEAEYEGLKEEILAHPTPNLNREQLVIICHGYEGDLVNRKELDELLGVETRGAAQVVNLLDRRIDYVEQNVRTVQKQIQTMEDKLAAASVISTPDVRNEEGLPMTEIIEELDEEGNVIASHTSTPGSAKPQLLEVLQKAGVSVQPSSSTSKGVPAANEKTNPSPQSPSSTGNKSQPAPQSLPVQKKPDSKRFVAKPPNKPPKKGVTFTEDTKSGPELEKSQTAKRIEEIMSIAKSSEATSSEPPVIPTNESLEEAALRRQMLQYGMSEVGSVVAELELEDGSDWSDEDYEDYGDDSTDDEDAFGRSTKRVVDDKLRQQMIDLEERLGARMLENVGKKASDYDIVQEGIGRVTINRQGDGEPSQAIRAHSEEAEKNSSLKSEMTKAKKSVKFSEELDISPGPQLPTPASARPANTSSVPPVGDIVERIAPAQSTTAPAPQRKASQFKSSRTSPSNVINGPLATTASRQSGPSLPLFPAKPAAPKPFSQSIQFTSASENTRTVPTGPEGRTLAAEIVERDVPVSSEVAEPDELDPQLLHQEVATEYHRMRNRMIQRQGGFVKEEETEIVPLTEEEGGPKKMSRFKAARLAKS